MRGGRAARLPFVAKDRLWGAMGAVRSLAVRRLLEAVDADRPFRGSTQHQKRDRGTMTDVMETDELTRLADAAETLARSVDSAGGGVLSDEARQVVERLRERRFEVAVVGEFNRGKSTLLNMLLDRVVLPAGVLPVTSIMTELSYGENEQARVTFADGGEEVIDLTQLEQYVTEEANPRNTRAIEQVQVTLIAPVLQHGAVLVDTPGVGSVFRHVSESAREVIVRADGAVMVLSADTPITDAERSLVKLLSRRAQKTFFVLNRIDILDPSERERVKWFVGQVLAEAFGSEQILYEMSAKTGEGFETFAAAFEEFLAEGLDEARIELARRDLTGLADRIENDCVLESSALDLSAAELEERLSEFRRAADWQHDAFTDDRVLFDHAGSRIVAELTDRLKPIVDIDDAVRSRLREIAEEAPKGEVGPALDKAIDDEVRNRLEPVRRREEADVERAWRRAADRLERATQRRADKLREVAGELFEVELHPIQTAQPANQKGRFFYSPPQPTDVKGGFWRRLVAPRNRDRAAEAAETRLGEELHNHADRVREDLSQRVRDANRELEQAMSDQVTRISTAMTVAVERGQSTKATAEQDQRAQKKRAEALREAAANARTAVRA